MKTGIRIVIWARTFVCLPVLGLIMGQTVAEPVVVTQPLAQTAAAGTTVNFTVEATGTGPLGYQWQTSPTGTSYTDIEGATNATLEILAELPTYQHFRVAVSDADGTVLSSAARLTVVTLPVITKPPPSLTVALGETITLRVEASSNVGRDRYQWRHGDVDLPGQTRATLTLTNIQAPAAGAYSVVISNLAGGSVCSEPALIQIGPTLFMRITTGPGTGAGGDRPGVWADYDNDGYVDLFVRNSQGTSLLYHNQGDGTFELSPGGALGSTSGSGTAVWGDYDNDGHIDICLTWAQSAGLYRNVGDGTFQRVSVPELDRASGASRGCAWADYDGDGDLDLFRAIADRQPDMLFENNGDGTFTRITQGPVVSDQNWSLGASWIDFDDDGAPDLFVTDTDGSSLFYRNHGDGSFSLADFKETGLLVGTVSPGLAWGDYDNDGDLDCFVPNHGDAAIEFENSLFRNNGDGSFTRITDPVLGQDAGQSWGAQWADYDNDGWLDLFVANGGWFDADVQEDNLLYHNNGDGTFSKVTNSRVGYDLGRSRGGSWADYDNDGFLDLFVPNLQPESDFLYRNGGNGNAWLILNLKGTVSNRSAFGAKVRLRAVVAGRELWQTRVVLGSDSFTGQDDPRAHFGLGDAEQADLIRIEWPSGILQELTAVQTRQILEIAESVPDSITVTQPPRSINVEEGKLAKLFAKVSGPPPLTFQWQKDGVNLPGASHRILTLSKAQSSDTGQYRLTISANGLAPVTTEEVSLGVIPPVGPAPHRFTGLTPMDDGTIQIHLAGSTPPGFHDIFGVDATDDFEAWTSQAYLASPNGSATFQVEAGSGDGRRFFRALRDGFWTPYPAPTGPYRVGTERRQLTDSTRSTRGPVVITIWYPAASGPSGPPAPWLEAALVPRLVADLNPAFSILSRVHSHAVARVPAASVLGAWPVILYSHGHWGLRSENTDLLTEFVSHGYFALAVDHIDAGLSALADGSLAEFRGGFDGATLQQRLLDLRFLMDQLEQWSADDPLLGGRLDLERIAAIGFSFGGEAALEVARIDARCRAAVGLDTGFHSSINTAGFAKPVLLFLGGLWNPSTDPVRSFFNQTPGPSYFLQVQGTVHHSFGYFGTAGWPELAIGALDNRRMNQLLRAYTLSFFNKHLKGSDDHRLDGPSPEYPEVEPFLVK